MAKGSKHMNTINEIDEFGDDWTDRKTVAKPGMAAPVTSGMAAPVNAVASMEQSIDQQQSIDVMMN